MTRKEVKKMLPIMQAFAEGKIIEYEQSPGVWGNFQTESPEFNFVNPSRYRIKPEPKYRPFESKEECFEEMKKHEPFGWIKDSDCIYNITIIDKDFIYFSDWENKTEGCAFEHALDIFTFMDGTPFGVKEE